jgi:hypothetical protein
LPYKYSTTTPAREKKRGEGEKGRGREITKGKE